MDPKYYVTLIKQLGLPPRISNCLKRAEMGPLFTLLIADPEDLPRLEDFEDSYLEEIYRKIGVFSCKYFHENEKGWKYYAALIQEFEKWASRIYNLPQKIEIKSFQKEYYRVYKRDLPTYRHFSLRLLSPKGMLKYA